MYLRNEGYVWLPQCVSDNAASSGSIEVVEWLRQQQRIEFGASALNAAAREGQTAICNHLRSIECDWGADTCKRATTGGYLDTLQWLRDNGCPWVLRKVCIAAAYFGYTGILDYLEEQGEVLDAQLLTDALYKAGSGNELQVVQWWRQRGAQWPAVLYQSIYDTWSSELLAWARSEGCTAPIAAAADDDV
jgi:hypothetical protein